MFFINIAEFTIDMGDVSQIHFNEKSVGDTRHKFLCINYTIAMEKLFFVWH